MKTMWILSALIVLTIIGFLIGVVDGENVACACGKEVVSLDTFYYHHPWRIDINCDGGTNPCSTTLNFPELEDNGVGPLITIHYFKDVDNRYSKDQSLNNEKNILKKLWRSWKLNGKCPNSASFTVKPGPVEFTYFVDGKEYTGSTSDKIAWGYTVRSDGTYGYTRYLRTFDDNHDDYPDAYAIIDGAIAGPSGDDWDYKINSRLMSQIAEDLCVVSNTESAIRALCEPYGCFE